MTGGSRRQVGTRRATQATPWRPVLLHALAITACVVAWGYLVWLAIDFGTRGRVGDAGAWWLLGLASLGAVACLFAALLVAVRLVRLLGITADPEAPPRVQGGRRAAR